MIEFDLNREGRTKACLALPWACTDVHAGKGSARTNVIFINAGGRLATISAMSIDKSTITRINFTNPQSPPGPPFPSCLNAFAPASVPSRNP